MEDNKQTETVFEEVEKDTYEEVVVKETVFKKIGKFVKKHDEIIKTAAGALIGTIVGNYISSKIFNKVESDVTSDIEDEVIEESTYEEIGE